MRTPSAKLLAVFIAVGATSAVLASTLDNLPFRVVLPDKTWKLNDSSIQPKGRGVYTMASLTNLQTLVTVRISKTDFTESPARSLDDICAGVRASFIRHSLKVVADEELIFLGCKAHRLSFQNQRVSKLATYNEAIIFAVGKTGWTIDCIGLLNQTNEVRQAFTLFQTNRPAMPPQGKL